jgi:hypothetical protein
VVGSCDRGDEPSGSGARSLLPRSLMSTAEKPMKIVSLLVKVREHVFFH